MFEELLTKRLREARVTMYYDQECILDNTIQETLMYAELDELIYKEDK